jgi:hypothetical protein
MEVEVAKIWLIKSSGRILGPFSLEEIIQLLTTKHLALIDEIRSPDSRWTFIREHKLLSHVVQFVRDQQVEGKEDTGSHTVTYVIPSQGTAPAPAPAPKTPPQSLPEVRSQAVPIAVQDITPAEIQPETPPAVLQKKKAFRFSINKDAKPLPTVADKKGFRWISIGLILAVTGVSAFIYINSRKAPSSPVVKVEKAPETPQQIQSNFEKFVRSTEFDEAYSEILKLENLQALGSEQSLTKLQIMVTQLGQNAAAQQILDRLDLNLFSEENKIEIQNLRGLIRVNESQYAEARKQFEEIEQIDSAFEPAQVNLMMTYLLEGQYSKVNDEFRKMMLAGVKEPSIFIVRAIASYMLNLEPAKLEPIVEDLKRFIGRYNDYQNEALFLLTAYQLKLGRQREASQLIMKLVKNDPDLTKKHFNGFSISRAVSQWRVFYSICENAVKQVQDAASARLLEGYCRYQNDDLQGAFSIIERGRIQFDREPGFIGMQSFLLFKQKRSSELEVFLKTNASTNDELFHLVNGLYCLERTDFSCAEREFRFVLAMNAQNLAALTGLSQVDAQQNRGQQLNYLFSQIESISNNYKPYLKLKARLNEK